MHRKTSFEIEAYFVERSVIYSEAVLEGRKGGWLEPWLFVDEYLDKQPQWNPILACKWGGEL